MTTTTIPQVREDKRREIVKWFNFHGIGDLYHFIVLGECLLTTVLECKELVLGGESGVTSRLPSRSIPPERAELKIFNN